MIEAPPPDEPYGERYIEYEKRLVETVYCVYCGARPGEPCTRPDGKLATREGFHMPRWHAAKHLLPLERGGRSRWQAPVSVQARASSRRWRWRRR